MRLCSLLAALLMGMGVVSCGENVPPPAQSGINPQPIASQQPPASPAGQKIQNVAANNNDVPVPPPNAEWTIFCDSVEGPGHVENASLLKSRLIQLSGFNGWYIVHSEKESSIFFGYYGSLENPAEKQRAEADRMKIASLTDKLGNHVLRGGVLQRVDAPDPQAPREWNLLNTPKAAYWTMEIGTFSGNVLRKEAAVEYVRELREKGEPAYYYHGPTSSSVCIGAWPRDAVEEQGTGIDKNGNMRDDAHTEDPTAPLLVFTDKAPDNLKKIVPEPGTGRPMTVMASKLVVQSDDMKKEIAKFPYHFVNYEYHGAVKGTQTFPDPSVLVAIPHEEASADDWQLTGGRAPADVQQTLPRPTGAAGDNVLRSIGDR